MYSIYSVLVLDDEDVLTFSGLAEGYSKGVSSGNNTELN